MANRRRKQGEHNPSKDNKKDNKASSGSESGQDSSERRTPVRDKYEAVMKRRLWILRILAPRGDKGMRVPDLIAKLASLPGISAASRATVYEDLKALEKHGFIETYKTPAGEKRRRLTFGWSHNDNGAVSNGSGRPGLRRPGGLGKEHQALLCTLSKLAAPLADLPLSVTPGTSSPKSYGRCLEELIQAVDEAAQGTNGFGTLLYLTVRWPKRLLQSVPDPGSVLVPLVRAIRQQRKVRLELAAPEVPHTQKRIVLPLRIVLEPAAGLRLLGLELTTWDPARPEEPPPCLIDLADVRRVEPLLGEVEVPSRIPREPSAWLEGVVDQAIAPRNQWVRVRVRIGSQQVARALRRPLCAGQQLQPLQDGSWVVVARVASIQEACRWVLSLGPGARILEPASLVRLVKEALRRMLRDHEALPKGGSGEDEGPEGSVGDNGSPGPGANGNGASALGLYGSWSRCAAAGEH